MTPKRRIIPVFVPHVGCPNNCVFCDQKKISGAVEPASAKDVVRAIEDAAAVLPEGETAELAFYGGSFTAIPQKEQEALLASAHQYKNFITSIRVSTRPDGIDKERLETLKKYGVKTVELGAQSLDNEVLRMSGRGHLAEDTERAANLVKEYGFNLILQMMTGLPGDTAQRTLETARKIIGLRPDGVRIYPTVIIKDTPLEEMWRHGAYTEHTVADAIEWCAPAVRMFWEANVDIIRIGLNPTEGLSEGTAVAGAYHPALGSLVYSRIYLDAARTVLSKAPRYEKVTLGVLPESVSFMTGNRRENIIALEKEFLPVKIKIKGTDAERGEVKLIDFS